MKATCERHQFESAIDTCRSCSYDFCTDCLVYPHGNRKPPLCVQCAVAAAGIRSTAARRPKHSGRRRSLA